MSCLLIQLFYVGIKRVKNLLARFAVAFNIKVKARLAACVRHGLQFFIGKGNDFTLSPDCVQSSLLYISPHFLISIITNCLHGSSSPSNQVLLAKINCEARIWFVISIYFCTS